MKYVKRLHALASTGLFFGASEFDRERYAEIGEIAQAMMADLADVPVAAIPELFPSYGGSYATPMIDVRAAIYQQGKVLLVQEKTDHRWTLPGGYADVGLSAGENVVKEVQEEACLDVEVRKLYAVRHKVKHGYDQDLRDFYKFFFLCETVHEAEPHAGVECLDAGYFALDNLPELSTGRTIAEDIVLGYAHYENPQRVPLVD